MYCLIQDSGDGLPQRVVANFGLGDSPGIDKAALMRSIEAMVQDQQQSGRRWLLVWTRRRICLSARPRNGACCPHHGPSRQTILLGQPQSCRIVAAPIPSNCASVCLHPIIRVRPPSQRRAAMLEPEHSRLA